jgi:APA family basic amino acid/polyamine antiporter
MDKSDRIGLKPALGLIDATAISIGAIIGAGIYVVIGIVAGLAGPALVISMLLSATVALFTALNLHNILPAHRNSGCRHGGRIRSRRIEFASGRSFKGHT